MRPSSGDDARYKHHHLLPVPSLVNTPSRLMPYVTSHQPASPSPTFPTPHTPPIPTVLAKMPCRCTQATRSRARSREGESWFREEGVEDTGGGREGDVRFQEGIGVGIVGECGGAGWREVCGGGGSWSILRLEFRP